MKTVTFKCRYCGKETTRQYKIDRTDKFCSRDCNNKNLIGKPSLHKGVKFPFKPRPQTRGRKPWNYGIKNPGCSGIKCHLWKGGITKENAKIRMSLEMKIWRRSVFERDSYTCRMCGKRGGDKHAHHILPFALYPEKRFDIENGITLCKKCHKKTDSYLRRNLLSDSPSSIVI